MSRVIPILDPQLQPTGKVSKAQAQEALDALQVREVSAAQVAASPLGPILVALVKHLMRGGFYQVTVEDEPTPSKANPLAQRRTRR